MTTEESLMQFSRVLSKRSFMAMGALAAVVFSFTAIAENFEIIDGSAQVAGAPKPMPGEARATWTEACDKWKAETKEFNKNDQMMMLACGSPSCDSSNGMFTCSSTATFKVKVVGTRVQATPPPPPPPIPEETETIVDAPPPQVIVEAEPPPRPGFVWISGYWGWHGHRHYWYPGHWESHRPGYVWVGPRWVEHGHRWHFYRGHWNH
jgi:hypothetical protein